MYPELFYGASIGALIAMCILTATMFQSRSDKNDIMRVLKKINKRIKTNQKKIVGKLNSNHNELVGKLNSNHNELVGKLNSNHNELVGKLSANQEPVGKLSASQKEPVGNQTTLGDINAILLRIERLLSPSKD